MSEDKKCPRSSAYSHRDLGVHTNGKEHISTLCGLTHLLLPLRHILTYLIDFSINPWPIKWVIYNIYTYKNYKIVASIFIDIIIALKE